MPNSTDRNSSVPALPAKPMHECYARPGVMYREADVPGAAKYLTLAPESTERSHKGDLGMEHMADFEVKPSNSGKSPFKNLKGGK